MAIKFMVTNTARGGPTHDTALNVAADNHANVILLQEPWYWRRPAGDLVTKTHPRYRLYEPTNRDKRARAVLYVDKKLSAEQEGLDTPDAVAVRLQNLVIVSAYNAPDDAGHHLVQILPRNQTLVVGGDLNAHHPHWNSNTRRTNAAGHTFASALGPLGLAVQSPLDVPTHRRGGVLDLVLGTPGTVETCRVAPDLAIGSDHTPLLGTLGTTTRGPRRRGTRLKKQVGENFVTMLKDALGDNVSPLKTPEEVEEADKRLRKAMETAYRATSLATTSGRVQAPWWSPRLREARQEAKATGVFAPFRKEVRKAKRDYWQRTIDEADTPEAVWKLAKWRKPRRQAEAPEIRVNNRVYTTALEKNKFFALRLEEAGEREDPGRQIGPPPRALPDLPQVSEEDAKRGLCPTNKPSTAPGRDNLTRSVWKAAWPVIGKHVTALYNAVLDLGYVPTAWKEAKVVMIQKPGKDDYTAPKSYRPISLLPCLAKGLEAIVAKFLSRTAVKYKVVSNRHAGPFPKRAAADLVLDVTQRAKAALQKGMVAGLAMEDVDGAFDAAPYKALLGSLAL